MLLSFIASLSQTRQAPPPEPVGDVTAQVALNRYAAQMTYNQNTDTLGTNKFPSEFWAFKHNIAATAFVSFYNTNRDTGMIQTGRVAPSVYYQTGKADKVLATQEEKAFQQAEYGYTPYCFSYANGNTAGPENYLPDWIGGRNSNSSIAGDSNTMYGNGAGLPSDKTARTDYISRASAMRYRDFVNNLGGGTQADADAYLEQELLKTKNNHGFFQDFTHWHTAGTLVRDMLAKTRDVLAGADVHYADYEEAIRYMWAREALQSVVVAGYTVNLTWGSFELAEALTIPVSVRVDTTGTALAGKEIASSIGAVLKKSANVFVVEVPYNTASFTLSETASPAYVDLTAPVVSWQENAGELVVTTSKPCKVVLWKVARGAAETAIVAPVRSNTLSLTHTFTVTSTDKAGDMYVGALTERKQSAVLGPIQIS